MNTLLKLEEAITFIASVLLFTLLPFAWWVYLACFLLPDIGMIGYLINTTVGAATYNLTHHKGIGIALGIAGLLIVNNTIILVGIIMVGHSAFDRLLGYGLKYNDNFKHTHLGWLK